MGQGKASFHSSHKSRLRRQDTRANNTLRDLLAGYRQFITLNWPKLSTSSNDKMSWVTFTRDGGDSENNGPITFGISRRKAPHLLGTSYFRVGFTFGPYNS